MLSISPMKSSKWPVVDKKDQQKIIIEKYFFDDSEKALHAGKSTQSYRYALIRSTAGT